MSELISRKDAISSGINKYFTGEECKNGHIAHRYIQSGTCEQCIRDATPQSTTNPDRLKLAQHRADIDAAKIKLRQDRLQLDRDKLAVTQQKARIRAAAKRDDLVGANIMLHYLDVDYFKAMMMALAMEIDPSISMSDLVTNKAPLPAGERAIHYFKAFQANRAELFALQDTLKRDREATGNDVDDIRWRAEMRRRAEEAAMLRADVDEDNGRPTDITA
jgi:hypothetical protein